MKTILFEIIIILILIVLNGFFALSEIALISAKKSRLKQRANQGNKKAQDALSLARKPSEMLSTIQIGITSIGIIAGVFGGATIAERIEEALKVYPLFSSYSEPISVFIVIVPITYLSLIIGELVPKQIALASPEKISLRVARPIRFFMKIARPFVGLLSYSSDKMLKLLRVKPAHEDVITEEEVKLLIAEGTESGAFEKSEQKMIENIFHIGNRPIKDFMTARKDIVWLSVDDPVAEIKRKISGSGKVTFLVYKNKLDNIIGAVETNDILVHFIDNGWNNLDLKRIVQPVASLSSDLPSLVAIERLKNLSINIALIKGKDLEEIIGLISFHNILEAIVGEFKMDQ
jgi:putative hemolysin